jgi:ABC-type amino acid transport system permease subunit
MFTGDSALGWFLQGLNVTLILVAGALLATLSLGVVWLTLLRSKLLVIRFSSRLMLVFFQNSPVILLLILGYLAVSMIWAYTIPVSILSAVIVIGLNNGANLAASLYEVWLTSGKSQSLGATLRTTMVPLRAALINAAKATPVAGFIGVSDLLATLNDETAYSGEQLTTFLVLTVVYLFLIQLVMVSVTKTTQFFVTRSAQP